MQIYIHIYIYVCIYIYIYLYTYIYTYTFINRHPTEMNCFWENIIDVNTCLTRSIAFRPVAVLRSSPTSRPDFAPRTGFPCCSRLCRIVTDPKIGSHSQVDK